MPKLKVHLALLTVGAIYGANFSIAKALMPDFIGPFGFILLRVSGALLLFLLAHSLWIREKIDSIKDYLRLLLCACLGVAVNMLCFFWGLSLTSPINASVMMTINPLLVVLFSSLAAAESLHWRKVLGIALGLAGALMQVFDPFGVSRSVEGISWQGDLLVLINASSYALYLVLVKPLMRKYHAFTIVKWTFAFGLIMVLPFGFRELTQVPWHQINTSILLALLFVVFGTTFLAYLLNAWSLKHVASSVVGAYIYVQPLLASAIAIFWGGYQGHMYMLVYAALIFGGIFMVGSSPVQTQNQESKHG
ncbi:MAG: DMT family transporter [Bacteroidetes bacterium]|nr:DMT family transporter [Bacteroidota bacterium]